MNKTSELTNRFGQPQGGCYQRLVKTSDPDEKKTDGPLDVCTNSRPLAILTNKVPCYRYKYKGKENILIFSNAVYSAFKKPVLEPRWLVHPHWKKNAWEKEENCSRKFVIGKMFNLQTESAADCQLVASCVGILIRHWTLANLTEKGQQLPNSK